MFDSSNTDSSLPSEFFEHYSSGYEAQRLQSGSSLIEFARTQEIVMRYLPEPPAVIFDVGGGPGIYACWLAKQGYEVHLIDVNPLHVELSRQASQRQPEAALASIEVGDARNLKRSDASADMILMFGPLYHLTERVDRLTALREAYRVIRSDGLLLAVGISRFTSALDGMRQGFFDDPVFTRIVERDLMDGQHRNPTNNANYFTTAYFHHPDELRTEVEESGFLYEKTLPIEGPLWLLDNVVNNFADIKQRKQFMKVARLLEGESSLLGTSAHLMVVARKA
jgi:ubiquinone/menaquinone biosynthesis C-methylase UbiE